MTFTKTSMIGMTAVCAILAGGACSRTERAKAEERDRPSVAERLHLDDRSRVEAAERKATDDLNRSNRASSELILQDGDTDFRVTDPNFVWQTEQMLSAAGFNPGPLDGIADEEMDDAIGDFQERNGLNKTGKLDRATADALGLDWSQAMQSSRVPVESVGERIGHGIDRGVEGAKKGAEKLGDKLERIGDAITD